MSQPTDKSAKKPSTKSPSPWSIRGVSMETRNAASLAARRAGKSVGEWLEGVVMTAAHAELKAPGVPAATTEDTLAAILGQLERRDQAINDLSAKVDAIAVQQRKGLLARLFRL